MTSKLFGEFMGTMILILMGNGVVANVLLKRSKCENSGWIVITAGWGFAVMVGVLTAIACGSPDAHLNPAVSVGVAVRSGDYSNLLPFLTAQLLGAMCGATLVWLHYLPHWEVTPEADLKLACFSTAPAIAKTGSNLFSEVLGTFVLVVVGSALGAKAVGTVVTGMAPYLVGMLVWAIGLSLGGTTGYAINPARDLGPRIMHSILPIAKKGTSHWSYAPVPVAGPLIGAAIAGLFVKLVGF